MFKKSNDITESCGFYTWDCEVVCLFVWWIELAGFYNPLCSHPCVYSHSIPKTHQSNCLLQTQYLLILLPCAGLMSIFWALMLWMSICHCTVCWPAGGVSSCAGKKGLSIRWSNKNIKLETKCVSACLLISMLKANRLSAA